MSYKTGAYVPFISRLAEETRRVGAFLSLDATQALGRCPVSVEGVDFLVSSSFKWLLGAHGLAVVYLSRPLYSKLNPASVGWRSVRDRNSPDRFERYALKQGAACLSAGMPNFPSMYVLRHSLQFLLRAGVENIFCTLSPLVTRLRQGLIRLGCDLLTPADRAYASGIVSFAHEKSEDIGRLLRQCGVIVWAGDGRVRASVHLYNDVADIDRYLAVLSDVLARLDRRQSAH